jgi:hypothetical protein
MSSENWPPKLKEWVAKCLGQMTASNQDEAREELRKVIASAYETKSLWTTDWDALQLESLKPPPSPFSNGLKRKSFETTYHGKKAKKASTSTSKTPINFSDQTALDRRTQRFQREHQLEKIKKSRPDTSNTASGSSTPTLTYPHGQRRESEQELEFDLEKLRIVGTCTSLFKDYLRLTSARQSL